MISSLSQTWPWYVAGPSIATIMFLLLYFGKYFGLSSNFRTICSVFGGGRKIDFFRINWKQEKWNFIFILGSLVGGGLSYTFFQQNSLTVSTETIQELSSYGINLSENKILPKELFSFDTLFSFKGIIILIIGGFLVGFGARYAGGCTSGHAISGLSSLQLPSLIATLGFFIGGLITTYLLLPYILKLS